MLIFKLGPETETLQPPTHLAWLLYPREPQDQEDDRAVLQIGQTAFKYSANISRTI